MYAIRILKYEEQPFKLTLRASMQLNALGLGRWPVFLLSFDLLMIVYVDAIINYLQSLLGARMKQKARKILFHWVGFKNC